MGGDADIALQVDCAKYLNIFDYILPTLGHDMEPTAKYLAHAPLKNNMSPQTPDETKYVYDQMKAAAEYVRGLAQLPDGWDRSMVSMANGMMTWMVDLYAKPVSENRGFDAHCMNDISFPRLEPSLLLSQVSKGEIQAVLKRFHLNRQNKSIKQYLNGDVIAGQARPGAKKLIIIYKDNHLHPGVQEEMLIGFINLYGDGVRTIGLESFVPWMAVALTKVDENPVMASHNAIEKSPAKILPFFRQEMKRMKLLIERKPPEWYVSMFYPAMARINVLIAAVSSQGAAVGIDNADLMADYNLTCASNEWASSSRSPAELSFLHEACQRNTNELRSHLAVRKMKQHLDGHDDQKVMIVPFGGAHIFSLVGELRKADYQDYSYLIVTTASSEQWPAEQAEWLYRQTHKLPNPVQLRPTRPGARWWNFSAPTINAPVGASDSGNKP